MIRKLARILTWMFIAYTVYAFVVVEGVLAIQQDPFDCKLKGDFVIPISRGEIVRSDKAFEDSVIGPLAVSIPSGTYRITLASFDDHDETDSTQPNESWFLLLSNGQATSAISDLPDADRFITEVVNEGMVIRDAIIEVTAVHVVFPDKRSPNSVVPLCASFTLIQEPTATPTTNPTATEIPPTATLPSPTETSVPTATSIPPTSTPKPTWTPQIVPTYCHPETGTCTDGGTG